MPRRAIWLATTALVVALAGCGGTTDDPILVPPSTTVDGSGSSIPAPTSGPAPPAEVVPLSVADGVPEDAPDLWLATEAGVTRWSVIDGPVVVRELGDDLRQVVGDGNGGAVGLTVDDQLLASVVWWPAEGEEVLLRSQGGLALHDRATRNDAQAVVITYSPIDSTEPVQVLDLLDLSTTSSRTVGQVGDATSGVAAIAASDVGFALVRVDAGCASLLTIDDTGAPVQDRTLPQTVCRDGEPAYTAIALSDDGTRLAVGGSDPEGTLLTVSVVGDDRVTQLPLPEGVDAVTAIDLSSRYLALATGASTHLIDLDQRTIVDLGIEAHAVQFEGRP